MKRIIYLLLFVLGSFGSYAQAPVKTGNPPVKDSAIAAKKKGIEVNPIKVWKNGTTVDGVDLDVSVAFEDLENMVRFYYELKDSTGGQIASGNVEISGDEYKEYSTQPNHARRAYNIVMRYLRLQQKATK
jgi:hypothetical protein